MGPTLTTVEEAQKKFNDPKIRDQVEQWHQQGVSFLDMLANLGITPSPDIKTALEGLTDAQEATIRSVMLAEIARSKGKAGEVRMPIDCRIRDSVKSPVNVAEVDKNGRKEANVTEANPS